ncbi:MAG: amidohydrolase [Pseudomonadota bacterium]|nr:MAG: amidohydrolase [Pseudomonadota bacterium]
MWDHRTGNVASRYLLDEYLADTRSGHNVVSSVFIECGTMWRLGGPAEMRPVGETEFANGLAAMSASGNYGTTRVAAGIVGTASLSAGDAVARVLDAQLAAGNGRFRGIRQAAARDDNPAVPDHRTSPPAGLYGDPKFRRGSLTWPSGPQFRGLVLSHPAPRAHGACPVVSRHHNHSRSFRRPHWGRTLRGTARQSLNAWCKAIAALAGCPNVVAKLGGIAMEVNGFGWHLKAAPPDSRTLAAATRRYFEHTIEAFGTDRCLFESNFPVDKVSCSYNVLWNAFKRLASGYSAREKAQLFHDNAVRIYRVE